ncbi:MAG: DegT/DnrJ/EryC1/StrS family aminotransferase [Phycisphaeraceae bacterium]
MAVPLIDLSHQHAALLPQCRALFERIVESGRFILGPDVEQFEQQLASYCGTRYAVGVSSGTDALLVAMMALGIGPGDEVITPSFTFFATAGSIARLGAKPVFVDVYPTTFNMDPQQIAPAVTDKTRAIIPVHLFGQAADMDPIMQVAHRHGLKVIEDAAQAVGARYRGRPVGSIGDVGCLSFYPTKNLAAMGDAGACVTDDADLQQKIRDLRVHGSGGAETHPDIGGNFRLDALQAAMLTVKLPLLDGWNEARRAHADRYHHHLEALGLGLPFEAADCYHTYNQYTIRVLSGQRDGLRQHLASSGIGNRIYYQVPLHLQPCFGYLGCPPGQLPVTEQAAREVLSLPIFPDLSEAQQDQVIHVVQEFFTGD